MPAGVDSVPVVTSRSTPGKKKSGYVGSSVKDSVVISGMILLVEVSCLTIVGVGAIVIDVDVCELEKRASLVSNEDEEGTGLKKVFRVGRFIIMTVDTESVEGDGVNTTVEVSVLTVVETAVDVVTAVNVFVRVDVVVFITDVTLVSV